MPRTCIAHMPHIYPSHLHHMSISPTCNVHALQHAPGAMPFKRQTASKECNPRSMCLVVCVASTMHVCCGLCAIDDPCVLWPVCNRQCMCVMACVQSTGRRRLKNAIDNAMHKTLLQTRRVLQTKCVLQSKHVWCDRALKHA